METSIQNGQVIFSHGEDRFTVTFNRTLRIPEDGNTYNLPAAYGTFPVKRVEDYKNKVPKEWLKHGGVFIPMWQREALWLGFSCSRRPFACKVAAGKINALSGKPWKQELAPAHDDPSCNDPRQDYCVAPTQRWLDGFNAGDGVIRQFVAMPLGQGYTVEGQVTGKEEFGGFQIMAVPPKDGKLMPQPRAKRSRLRNSSWGEGQSYSMSNPLVSSSASYSAASASLGVDSDDGFGFDLLRSCDSRSLPKAVEMGLAAGGSITQKIYPDPHGLDTWSEKDSGRIFIHIVNSEMYEQITGEKPPKSPITAEVYQSCGYSWFSMWDSEMGDLDASSTLSGVKTISQKDIEHGFVGQQNDSPLVAPTSLKYMKVSHHVKDGEW